MGKFSILNEVNFVIGLPGFSDKNTIVGDIKVGIHACSRPRSHVRHSSGLRGLESGRSDMIKANEVIKATAGNETDRTTSGETTCEVIEKATGNETDRTGAVGEATTWCGGKAGGTETSDEAMTRCGGKAVFIEESGRGRSARGRVARWWL